MEKIDSYNQILSFLEPIKHDKNHRYKSWEHCFAYFSDRDEIRKTKDYKQAALHLFVYLASWGMYRGSSFLLEKDYLVHEKAIEIILDQKYDSLLSLEPNHLNQNNLDKLNDLVNKLRAYYNSLIVIHKSKKANITDTLLSKILLGTLACSPAFDEYFIKGMRIFNIKPKKLSISALISISDLYLYNEKDFIKARKFIKDKFGFDYPPFKLIDMFFWISAKGRF